ncbi:MAG: DNA polymerase III subunit gamma/tau [Oscillospiraceae bacterium]
MYQALYRKWRPQVFADVVGQPHITTTLMNEINGGRSSHAYLFTGSRGTGKTTCAKIFAKAVNCQNPKNGDPCNQCEMCRGIDNGSIMDVIEIDAASNNGVDNIRDLREEVNFTPVNTKYRVYIIDEVHMLSMGAFNALLKTLEEPPQHVKFILATTEVHKLPATILSRCQRFDFHRIPPEDIAKRLCFIAEQESATLEDDAAILIARLSDGALRDALSILDQCMVKGKDITIEIVNEVVGLAGSDYLFSLSGAMMERNSAKALETIDYLHNHSCDMERLCDELINHFRNLMIVKTVKAPQNLIVCTDKEFQNLQQTASCFEMDGILYAIDILGQALSNLRRGLNRRLEMEMTMIKLCSVQVAGDKELSLRIKALEDVMNGGDFAAPTPLPIPSVSKPPVPKPMAHIPPQAEPEMVVPIPQIQPPFAEPKPITPEPKDEPIVPIYEEHETIPLPFDIDEPPAVAQHEEPQNFVVTQQSEQPSPVEQAHTQPVQQPAQSVSAATEQPTGQSVKDGEIDPQKWLAVIREATKTDKGLIGAINNSSAYKNGNVLVIKSDNILFKIFMENDYHKSAVKQAVEAVLGQELKITLDDNPSEKVEQKKPQDPLDNLINHAQNLDFNFKIEE